MNKKIGVIVKKKRLSSYENSSLRKEAQKLNYNLDFIFVEDLAVKLTNQGIKIYYQGYELGEYIFFLNRLGSSTSVRDANLLETINCVTPVINDGSTSFLLKDKYQTALRLQQAGIKVIPTMINERIFDINTINKLMEYPIINKSNTGSLGKGIYKLENDHETKNILQLSHLVAKDYFYILQDFIKEANGEDIRVIVYLGEVLCAMKRSSVEGDFKANFSLHQQAQKVEVTDEIKDIALKVVDTLGCSFAGIDLMQSKEGYVVCEVNSAPGFMGMDSVQDFSLANKILYLGNQKFNK